MMQVRRLITVFAVLVLVLAASDADAKRKKKNDTPNRNVGAIVLKCAVSGATVLLDDKEIGKTPIKELATPVGEHTIQVKKLGFLYFTRKVEVKKGKSERIKAELLPFAGVIEVTSKVEGSMVLVDGIEVGTAPIEHEVKLGKRDIEIKAEGYKTFSKKIRAVPGKRYKIKAKLKKGKDPDPLALASVEPGLGALPGAEDMPLPGAFDMPLPGIDDMALPGIDDMALPGIDDMALPDAPPPPGASTGTAAAGDLGGDLELTSLAALEPPPTEAAAAGGPAGATTDEASAELGGDGLDLALPSLDGPTSSAAPGDGGGGLALEGFPDSTASGDGLGLEGLPGLGGNRELTATDPVLPGGLTALPGMSPINEPPPPPPIYKRWYFIAGVAGGVAAVALGIIIPVAVSSSGGGGTESTTVKDGVWRPGDNWNPGGDLAIRQP